MERRHIGSLDVSVIAVGCNNFGQRFDEEQSCEVVETALDCGINYFDTSDSYGEGRSEECLGFALRKRRADAVIATKYDGAPSSIRASAQASLRRLGTDYIDLYQIHHPYLGAPVQETLEVLGELVADGMVREIGCSNFDVPQLRDAADIASPKGPRFVSIQNDYNLLNRKAEFDVLPECAATGIAFNAYFPLYHGLLTGKFIRGAPLPTGSRLEQSTAGRQAAVFTDRNFDIVEALAAFAAARGRTLLDVALARLLYEPGVASVIAGATWGEQVRANAHAATWTLSPEDLAEIDRICPPDASAPDTPSRAGGIA